jgi:K+-transporting ATPase ATPase C chain
MRLPSLLGQHLAALRLLLVFTVVLGVGYPLAITAVATIPGLHHQAEGSLLLLHGRDVGSALIGQSFTNAKGVPLPQYLQSRPSAAGAGYDPTSTSASNLGPESIVDTSGSPSLLSQVCARSLAVGALEGVSGARPYCTPGGVGAVLAVFHRDGLTGPISRVVSLNEPAPATPFLTSYHGVRVEAATVGADYRQGVVTPIRGSAPGKPAVPADAVTASASGLDYQITPAYARLQLARVARVRGITPAQVQAVVSAQTTGRTLGFMGEPAVNVLKVNLDLDRRYPYSR